MTKILFIIISFIIGCLVGMRYERGSKVIGYMRRETDSTSIDDRLRNIDNSL